MAERVTIQDIADALGVSRNTVSKAINNTGVLAEKTRELVLRKAVEMGYKQFSYVNVSDSGSQVSLKYETDSFNEIPPAVPAGSKGVIALLTTSSLDNSHFSSTMLDKFHREFSELGYSFTSYRITVENLTKLTLPACFRPENIAGILCIELFHTKYSDFICSLGIPTLFADAPVSSIYKKMNADILLMDNRSDTISLVKHLASRGIRRFGFIGEIYHCRSFYERYHALREALWMLGISYDDKYTISFSLHSGSHEYRFGKASGFPDYESYCYYIGKCLDEMEELPEVFFCSNDFVAIDTLSILRQRNISVPDQILLCGFDDSAESRVITPSLTTVHIHSQIMGYSATQLLLSRIKEPTLYYRTVYTETTLHIRESTRTGNVSDTDIASGT